jgi:hypothetical protein
MNDATKGPVEIEAIHVVLATILTMVICAFTGVVVFPNGSALAEFIVTWFLVLGGVWALSRNRKKP